MYVIKTINSNRYVIFEGCKNNDNSLNLKLNRQQLLHIVHNNITI